MLIQALGLPVDNALPFLAIGIALDRARDHIVFEMQHVGAAEIHKVKAVGVANAELKKQIDVLTVAGREGIVWHGNGPAFFANRKLKSFLFAQGAKGPRGGHRRRRGNIEDEFNSRCLRLHETRCRGLLLHRQIPRALRPGRC